MTDAPERLWIQSDHIPDEVALNKWTTKPDGDEAHLFTEYVRADLAPSWQPIETAPKNQSGERGGPAILVWNSHSRQIIHACWTTDISNGVLRTGWWSWCSTGPVYPITPTHKVTHWMLLPEAPE